MPDLIITGVPRSGTTLAAAIIDQTPNCLVYRNRTITWT